MGGRSLHWCLEVFRMIRIKPTIDQETPCPYCGTILIPYKVLWRGIHVCAESRCSQCNVTFVDELRIGHGVLFPHCIDSAAGKVFQSISTLPGGQDIGIGWGESLLKISQNPSSAQVTLSKEVFHSAKRVVILNCIDNLYGHCLLKLLNAQRHLDSSPEFGLVVLVPKFLRWMVPDGVAEICVVLISP